MQMSTIVFKPACFLRSSRSRPSAAPQKNATNSTASSWPTCAVKVS